MGNKLMCYAKVTGDGSTTTINVPMGRIESAFVGNGDESAGYNPALTWSGQTITYGAAPTNTKYHYLHVIGTD
jgi:hypothetical protein